MILSEDKPLVHIENASLVQYPDGTYRLNGITYNYPEWHYAGDDSLSYPQPGKNVTTSAVLKISLDNGQFLVETMRTVYRVSSWYGKVPDVENISFN